MCQLYNFLVKEYVDYPDHPNTIAVKYPVNEIHKAYHKLTGEISDILAAKNFKKLRRACYQEISAPTSTLPKSLVEELKPTKSLDDMLDVLALSPYWNWFDTRLLEALVSASGSPEAEAMLEQFKQIYYSCKVSEVLPCVIVRPLKESIVFIEKFNKDPEELTLFDLLQHKHILEYDVMEVGEGKIVLSCIRTGCVELWWQVPLDLVYQAHTVIKKNFHKLSLVSVESLICKQADEFAGLPVLWRGQEVGGVGSIEPLPEHVRQEPYSLPQGFHWVTLSGGDPGEMAMFIVKCTFDNIDTFDRARRFLDFIIIHPSTKPDWLFGIRTTNGKLVGMVLANPICISIRGVSLTCIRCYILSHPKYYGKRIWYVLIKELTRRGNLCNVNHLVLTLENTSLLKPLTTTHIWRYSFNLSTNSQLPSSPRTPGWRRMTSEDVPSVLALINKWSSQFEIRQVFNSEEELFYKLILPAIPNFLFTYVVENESNSITDIVTFRILDQTTMTFDITALVCTQSPVTQLITDALVCAKEKGAKVLQIRQHTIKPEVLLSASFQLEDECSYFSIYNYSCHEVPETNVWYM